MEGKIIAREKLVKQLLFFMKGKIMAITIQNHELQVTLKALSTFGKGTPLIGVGKLLFYFLYAEVFEMIASFTDQLKLHILRVSYQGMALYVTKHSTMITYRILLFVLQLKVVKKC